MKKRIVVLFMMTTVLLVGCGGKTQSDDTESAVAMDNSNFQKPSNDEVSGAINAAVASENGDSSDEIQQIIRNAEEQGRLNENISWYYKDNTLVISGSGDVPYNSRRTKNNKVSKVVINEDGSVYLPELDNHGFWSDDIYRSIEKVIIGNNITGVGSYVFYDCNRLTEVVLPNSVTTIGDYAFSKCPNLSTICLPDNVQYIGDYAFYDSGCYETLQVPDDVELGEKAIYVRKGESDITFYKTATRIKEREFSDNHDIRYVVIPEGFIEIGDGAFSACDNLKSVIIPDTVTTIGRELFCNCGNLTSVTLSANITNIPDRAFDLCWSLEDISIPDGVTSIGSQAFNGCWELESISIPDSVIHIGDDAFGGLSTSLKQITWNGSTYCSLEEFWNAWSSMH